MALAYSKKTNPEKFIKILSQFDTKNKDKNDAILYKLLNAALVYNSNSSLKQNGKGLFDFVIDNLPFELHVPQLDPKDNTIKFSNFIGPGTQLFSGKTRLNPDGTPKHWSQPLTNLDNAAYHHDLAYSKKGTNKNEIRKKADDEFVREAKKISDDPNEHLFNRLTANITGKIINKLGNNR